MKLLLCKPRGFCAGVVRAVEIVEKALKIWSPPVYVKHEIVHNRHVVEELKAKGAVFVEDLADVPDGARVIYSAHGIPPSVREEAKRKDLKEIDATCPLVTKLHSAVVRYARKGYKIVLLGHKNHVEVIGTLGEAPESTIVVENQEDIAALPFDKNEKIFYLMQTTLGMDEVAGLVRALKEKYPDAETLPSSSICFATTNRQEALKNIIEKADLVLVVGDPKSSNSNRLREVGEYRGVPSYLINGASEIDALSFDGVRVIGMTAGASTPDSVVFACIARLRELGVSEVEEVSFTEETTTFELPKEIRFAEIHG